MTEVTLPEDLWSEDGEGVITAWLCAEGEHVVAGAVLAEVMYEKAGMELLAPASGTLLIVAPANTPVRRGQLVARIL